MTPQIALTLGILVVAVVLFATELLRVDVIALLVLLALGLTGLVGAEELFSGFASPAVVTVWAVYIVSGALFRTGVADFLGERIVRVAGTSEPRLIAIIMLTCGVMSAFMNNIGATAVLLPAVAGISRQAKVPLSKLLIPLSFSSLLGGNMTLIGTPPNVLAASLLTEAGLPSLGFFDFFPTGAIVFAAGIVYMVFVGRHLLPVRQPVEEVQAAALREYVSEVRVPAESKLVGQTLAESGLGAEYDLTVVAIVRDEETPGAVNPQMPLEAGDLLLVEGTLDRLVRARDALGLVIEAERKWELDDLDSEEVHVVEATLAPRSRMEGRTLRGMHFRDRYGFTALAISRHGAVVTRRLRDARLQFGDALLLVGPRERLAELQEEGDFLVLEPLERDVRRRQKAPIAVGAMGLALALVVLADFPIAMAMVIGAVVVVLGRSLTMDEAYQSIEWRSVFLIAGMLPLGMAMESTGTARFLAGLIVDVLGPLGPLAILAGIYLLAGLITEPMSNAAATVLMVPIAIDVALGLGANPQPFVLATVIGASTSFLTPVGHQANVLVLGPGGYRFFDYTRVGGPLNVVLMAVTLIALPLIWPLF
ncbi:MAG TPA: SLC13 family permease [Anaerolineae bacterium]|nr:SLC13 family permease [Anaerolineae bacterium]